MMTSAPFRRPHDRIVWGFGGAKRLCNADPPPSTMEPTTLEVDVSDRTGPTVKMVVALETEPDTVTATVTLDGLETPYAASAEARRSTREPDSHIEVELAVSRALARLQHQIMERVHERINRSATDDI
jgi:Rv2632c-like